MSTSQPELAGDDPKRGNALLVVVSDTHSGHVMALPWGDGEWITEGKSPIAPAPAQLEIWRHWVECWEFVGELRRRNRARLIVAVNGDVVEGIHHDAAGLITTLPGEQARMHEAAMLRGMALAGYQRKRDSLFYIGGTPAHDGRETEDAEGVARKMIPGPLDGKRVVDRLYKRINGVLVDVAHHGFGKSINPWLAGNSVRTNLRRQYEDCLDFRQPMPRYVVRSHKHVPDGGDLRGRDGEIISEGYITGGWKLPDSFVQTLNPAAFGRIGMLALEIASNGVSQYHPLYMTVVPDEAEDI